MAFINETIDLLGLEATDRVTEFKGIITSVCFDLYGCVQVALTPTAKEGDTELKSGHWFDVGRMKISDRRVMDAPNYAAKEIAPTQYDNGPSFKPEFSSDGRR